MTVANRVVVSPMCMYSAKDGMPDDFHLVHYGSRALGGAGLMFTEMTVRFGATRRITPGCAGFMELTSRKPPGRASSISCTRNSAAKICLQLGHSGRKGATKLMWDGMDRPLEAGRLGRDLGLANSLLPRQPGAARDGPRRDGCGARPNSSPPAQRGEACGFDMLELHCAHGYLLASFISPLTNQRTDAIWRLAGKPPALSARSIRGDARGMAGAQADVGAHFRDRLGGGRHHRRRRGRDRARLCRATASIWSTSRPGRPCATPQPVYGRMFQTPFSDQIRNEARVATMCVGNITTADQVNTILAAGRADLVALGRPHLVDPALHAEGRGLVRRGRVVLPAAIPARQGADFPQQRARPAGFRGPEN